MNIKILVINSGSSSIKYQLFEMPKGEVLAKGLLERISQKNSCIRHSYKSPKGDFIEKIFSLEIPDHKKGLEEVNKILSDKEIGVIKHTNEIKIVGHRVLHGGNTFKKTTLIDKKVKEKIKENFSLGPLHNPANLMGIEVSERIFREATQIAVFDTSFHHSIPEHAHRYALNENFYKDHQIRVYGFHGISHKYVSQKAIEYLKDPNAKIINLHLGNGASLTAIQSGISKDTSMGLGPNQGLIMGTRSGDIDSAFLFYALNTLKLSTNQLSDLLNKQSGMLALCGNSDMRDISDAYKKGDEKSILAYKMYSYRIQKYIGSYAAILNGVDAIVFTGGVGENDVLARELICKEMDFFGISLDQEKNKLRSSEIREIQNGKVKILIVPTDEEKQIAKESFELYKKIKQKG